jgi:hypothetical protein
MPLVPNFTVAQTTDPSQLLLTDTSTGSDVAITDRKILLFNSAGNQIPGSPFDWPIADASITIAPLTADLALNIQVDWNNSGGVALYTKSLLFAAVQFAEQFYYNLTQQQSATTNLSILNDLPYFENKSNLRTFIDSAVQAIAVGSDIFSAQFCISLYQQLLNNPNLYF